MLRAKRGRRVAAILCVSLIVLLAVYAKFPHRFSFSQATSMSYRGWFSYQYLTGDMLVDRLPGQGYSSSTVYYVWCGQRLFEFSHYLSVLSVQKLIRPSNIVFLHESLPVDDSQRYYLWFQELKERLPFFRTQPLRWGDGACYSSGDGKRRANLAFVRDLLMKQGGIGIYINESTVLIEVSDDCVQNCSVLHATNNDQSTAMLLMRRRTPDSGKVDADHELNTKTISCLSPARYNIIAEKTTSCLQLQTGLFPKDIWNADDAFGRYTRTLFYDTPEIPRQLPSYDDLIPNIAHVVWLAGDWLGGSEMDFPFFLCVNSLVYVANVDKVYIHGDVPPHGKYWDLIKNNSRIQLIHQDRPTQIYSQRVKGASHTSDTMRAEILIKYGGIYIDTDAIFVKPLSRDIRGYATVLSFDLDISSKPVFPNMINTGVALSKRGAPFWHKFQETMKVYIDSQWSWNACGQPYRLIERQPNLVHVDPHLQIICFKGQCHPTFPFNSTQGINWRTDAFAFHWTNPTPQEFTSHRNLLKASSMKVTSMNSQIGMYVLQQAGLVDYFKRLH